jgi:hypothetical protein
MNWRLNGPEFHWLAANEPKAPVIEFGARIGSACPLLRFILEHHILKQAKQTACISNRHSPGQRIRRRRLQWHLVL